MLLTRGCSPTSSRELLRQVPHFLDVGPAEPVLHRASGRRTHRQQVHVHIQAGKFLPGQGLDLGPEALAGLDALGHDDHLAVVGVRRLRVEGENEPHGALADIGRPVIDVGIACELGLEAVHLRLRVGNRGVLRQGEVDEELVAVRGREELLLDELHAVERDAEHRHRHADGQPAPAHGADEDARERRHEAARLVVMLLHRLRQQRHAEQGREQHRDDPRQQQRGRDHHEQREGELARVAAVETDRDEARDGDERAGEHRERGGGVDGGGGLRSVSPASSRATIISTAIIASSTRRPSAMMRAPSEMRCNEMPVYCMTTKVMASTSGIDSATTNPARMPRLRKLTTSTIATASNRALVKPPTASSTTMG